ncbi:hypothetical protein [Corynebacterium tuberculostearicum]|uniref:hypothetical protein n=1 Tax=Corynebacterium tuberculostearicum TaxID=38304 RepID=UPI002648424D|nr:hypothetical protein [Corynebacterium tuberculostearicum]MDV2433975.1 hypothetical protein [Corynebacterium tuberculostearicum]WKE58629.1 hypothetical protein KAH61_06190 [Corynebacterium tuberculostearicum]
MVLFIGFVLAFAEGWLLNIPWLADTAGANVGTLCSFSYAALPVIFFRNQISRLEAQSSRNWLFIDGIVLVTLWIIPWVFSLCGIGSTRFAYVSTVLTGLTLLIGRYVGVDTLALSLVAQLVLQTALWPSLSDTNWKLLLFALEVPPGRIPLLLSAVSFFVSVVSLRKFKRSAF